MTNTIKSNIKESRDGSSEDCLFQQKNRNHADKMEFDFEIPGDSIRPVDPIVSDRIRVGFYRNPTFSIKSRSDLIACRRIPFSRNPTRISSEFNGIR